MSNKILVTDSLFIGKEHEYLLNSAGYEIERLDTPLASEAELKEAIQGKVGYILGGIEKVTSEVIGSADTLKVIAFTGADWRQFIPGYETARNRGIAITNTPGANTGAVSEYTLALMLAMVRRLPELCGLGGMKFLTTNSLSNMTVGIVGMGRIGSRVAYLLKAFGVQKILYTSRTRKLNLEETLGITYCSLEELFKESDLITLHASKEAGAGFISATELGLMKDKAVIINCGFTGAIDADALFSELLTGRLRAAQDDPMDDRFQLLPVGNWLCSNSHTAFNTYQANRLASDMATQSIINILKGLTDPYMVL